MCYIIWGLGAVTGLLVTAGNSAGIQVSLFFFFFSKGKGIWQDSEMLTDF